MTYLIVSPRIGQPGTVFVPQAGTNVAALLEGGHIVVASETTAEPAPQRKVRSKTPKE